MNISEPLANGISLLLYTRGQSEQTELLDQAGSKQSEIESEPLRLNTSRPLYSLTLDSRLMTHGFQGLC